MTFDPTAVRGNDPRFTTITQFRKTASFTLEAQHAGARIIVDSPVDVTCTVPTGVSVPYPSGGYTEIVQGGAGRVLIAAASGVTVRSASGLRTSAQYDSINIIRQPGVSGGLQTTNMLANYMGDNIAGTTGGAAAWPDAGPLSLPDIIQPDAAKQPSIVGNAINNHKALNFNSTSQTMAFQGTALDIAKNRSALTISMVVGYPATQSGIRTLLSLSTGASTTLARTLIQHRDATNGFLSAGARALDADAGQFAGGGGTTAPENFVLTVEWDYIGRKLTVYKNGTQTAQNLTWQSGVNSSNTTSQVGAIGSNAAGTGEFFGGRVGHIVAHNEVSANLRANVHTYFQNTYAIAVADFGGTSDEWYSMGGVA